MWEQLRGKNVFLTGGAGFIGSHAAAMLLDSGARVTIYDNLSSGLRENLAHVEGRDGFRFVAGDMLDEDRLKPALAGHDLVFHLGASTDIPGGLADTRRDLLNCAMATRNVLEGMRTYGIKEILFASSSTIYGETNVHPTPEDVGPVLPISLYGAAKLACEGLISSFCHLFGLQAWIFRFGNVVGARMGHGILYDFIEKLRRNQREMEILGDGKQQKNYFLVEDCLSGIIHAYTVVRDRPFDVFNLGSPTTVLVDEIADMVVEECGLKDVSYTYTGGRRGWPGDVPIVMYDVSKMKNLGWEARYSSAQAVRIATRRLLGKEG